MSQRLIVILITLLLVSCTAAPASTPTPVAISKLLVTVELTATANPEQLAATRAAVSPTPIPPTATIIPTETPYVGVFIGEAEPEEGFATFREPIFGPEPQSTAAQPTADAGRCPIPISAAYVAAWRANPLVNQRLGCPIQEGFGFFGETQVFEGGVMYSYPDINAVYAIRPLLNGIRGEYDYLENPPDGSTIGVDPAERGQIVPGGIFGDTWLAVSGLRNEMGFARSEAAQVPLGLQRFQNGTFLLDAGAGQVYALVVDGTVLGPFLAPVDDPTAQETATPTPTAATPDGAPVDVQN